jgi:hypothetical protein
MPERRELSATEVQLIKSLLIADLSATLVGRIDGLESRFNQAMAAQTVDLTGKIQASELHVQAQIAGHDKRLADVEKTVKGIKKISGKLLIVWGAIVLITTSMWVAFWNWLSYKLRR